MAVPQMFLTWVAAQTSQVRLASGVTLLPHHDAVRIAEDFATLDVLSDGRAEVWVGKGVEPGLYRHFDQEAKNASDMQTEGLELLIKLWTERDVYWQGQFRTPLEGVTLEPRPIQTPHPPIYVAAGSLKSVELPARLGIGVVITTLAVDNDVLANMCDHYRAIWSECGHEHSPMITILSHVHCAVTSQAAFNHLKKYQFDFQRWVFAKRFGVNAKDVELPPRIMELEKATSAIVVGSPQEVTDRISHQVELSGCDRFIYQGDYGGQPWPVVMDSLRLFATEVMPQLRGDTAKKASTNYARPMP
jgi:alkanesulfonate monooxygenase SsuD/methylene tetrahydromethanopterin reductase-like flavin-dependent oxidoreductase (luciferase family)